MTVDEVPPPVHLGIRLQLNGQVMQDSNTSQFMFDIPTLIAYISQVTTLQVGDLIFTGTPSGVGDGRKPPVYLRPADTVEVVIEKIGRLRNPVV
jgi:2-keto-4-pentenoate hydratase/2-oxohepta-3-ene-1,7-dioic acid hydratase in catechol pathway